MSAAPDLVIIGAGIVGAACAEACARAGLRVLVLDRGHAGGGATATGMGHIVVMDDSEAQFALTAWSRGLWRDLAPELPAGAELDRCGTLWVAADDEEMAAVRRKADYYSARGVKTEVVAVGDLQACEPSLRPGLAGGLRVPDDLVLYPPAAARFLLERARQSGRVELRQGAGVRGILAEGGVELLDGTRVASGRAVNACGCDAPQLTAGLPVRRRKGHLVITDRHPGFVRHQVIELGYLKSAHRVGEDSVACNVQPRRTGQMLIGSSRQFDQRGADVDLGVLRQMLVRAAEYLPGIGRLSALRAWAGHRAATPDKLPIIGPSPENDRVWMATGHEGLGITTSLGTGQLLADRLLGRATSIPSAPYDPARWVEGVSR